MSPIQEAGQGAIGGDFVQSERDSDFWQDFLWGVVHSRDTSINLGLKMMHSEDSVGLKRKLFNAC